MKITHICLCGPVTDYWSYQDNLLPKYHSKLGHEVSVVTSRYIYSKNGELDYDNRFVYYNEHDLKTIRLSIVGNKDINYRFKRYRNLFETIINEKPEILFIHGVQFLDIFNIIKYLKINKDVIVYIDNHADYSNSAQNWFSNKVLHGIIWKFCSKKIEKYTKKFYGVLPARKEFLQAVYKINQEKVELLVMGADDEKVIEAKKDAKILDTRRKYNLSKKDFVIITGGKIDKAKWQVTLLMKAINQLNINNVKLIVFGPVIDELKDEIELLSSFVNINYIGWIDSDETYNLLAASDLAVFPGRHSVLWEQAVGSGIPCVFKYWEGTTHVDIGGNCKFLYHDSLEEILNIINEIVANPHVYEKMKKRSLNKGVKEFSYAEIARRSLS